MARKPRDRPRSVASPDPVAKLKRDLTACVQRIEELERQMVINIRRMGSMQAEIDHLRSLMRSV